MTDGSCAKETGIEVRISALRQLLNDIDLTLAVVPEPGLRDFLEDCQDEIKRRLEDYGVFS